MTQPVDGVGVRVRERRKLAGLTQRQLAERSNLSLSLVRKVEQGDKPASPGFISAAARALNTGIDDLTNQPFPRNTRDEQQVHAGIVGIRRELASYRIEPFGDIPPRPIDELASEVATASAYRHGVKLGELGHMLPGLLSDLRTAWHSTSGSEQERVFALAAEAYAATSQVVYKLGYIDLSSLAVERYEWAAARSGDELMVLAGDYQRAGELIMGADWAASERLLESSRSRIEDRLGTGDPVVLSMWGNLHLKSGLAAARAGRRDVADAHLAEATDTAQRIGEDRNDYQLCFGPTNVDIWRVGLAVEGMDGSEAVRRAQSVKLPRHTPKERAGHYYIDLARGFLLHGDKEGTLHSLHMAKRIAPTQTRYHTQVHETVRQLARDEVRSTESIRGFAAWCGITPF
ncbi:helix-turn-helix domain-containing protein [Nocardia blacklockiae]|uniref:helix-turn-helix domain-containing protein n=1 Tax=Nocardia blacklockiae TaxID=480036 RepID=UPI00189606F8|nr:helix-turn-helix transcriptional regulator [Nocardia blacklockiae]MBF6175969.1 helix-turn-helix transcriptional regulator [Nocardia blacklockiae]